MRQKRNHYIKKKSALRYILYFILLLFVVIGTVIGSIAIGWMKIEHTPFQYLLSWTVFEQSADTKGSENTGDSEKTQSVDDVGDRPDEQSQNVPESEGQVSEQEANSVADKAAMVTLGRASIAFDVTEEEQRTLRHLDGLKIASLAVFSLDEWATALGSEQSVDDQLLSQTASVLYEAAIRSGMEPVERYLHEVLPEGFREGFDVRYERGVRDFSFYNPLPFDVVLHFQLESGTATALLASETADGWQQPIVTVSEAERLMPDTMLLSDALHLTGRSITNEGREGLLIKVYRTSGDEVRTLVSKDYYAPQPVIMTEPLSGQLIDQPDSEE